MKQLPSSMIALPAVAAAASGEPVVVLVMVTGSLLQMVAMSTHRGRRGKAQGFHVGAEGRPEHEGVVLVDGAGRRQLALARHHVRHECRAGEEDGLVELEVALLEQRQQATGVALVVLLLVDAEFQLALGDQVAHLGEVVQVPAIVADLPTCSI